MSLEILVVDYYDMIQFLHKETLALAGISIIPSVFSNGALALEYLLENAESNSEFLVLLDLNMPVMNGFAFLESLPKLQNRHNIHVIVVSSSVDEYDKKKAISFPEVIEFMEKPLRFKDCIKIKTIGVLEKYFGIANSVAV